MAFHKLNEKYWVLLHLPKLSYVPFFQTAGRGARKYGVSTGRNVPRALSSEQEQSRDVVRITWRRQAVTEQMLTNRKEEAVNPARYRAAGLGQHASLKRTRWRKRKAAQMSNNLIV